MKVLVVIPARYGSTRFGAKVLAADTGKYLVQHTYEQAMRASSVEKVLIATDNEQVMAACDSFGGACVMTSPSHQSGTDRIAEAVKDMDVEIVVNVQADEPEIDPGHIDFLVQLLRDNPDAPMATLVTGFDGPRGIADPNVVKVILDVNGRAIYFSRSVIPYDRQSTGQAVAEQANATGQVTAGMAGIGRVDSYLRHLGIYAYRRDFLMEFTSLGQGPLEKLEKLEQLRAIEYGFKIIAGRVDHSCQGIDTPGQYQAFVKRWMERNSKD